MLIDLLTDSGTGAMSSHQWAGMMRGDESYAGASSFYRFEESVRTVTGLKHIIPTHQGRAAERILFGSLLKPGDIVPNNTHFDTTRANVEYRGATALDIPNADAHNPDVIKPFKGNIDLEALERVLDENPGRVPIVMLTVTNNSVAAGEFANIACQRNLPGPAYTLSLPVPKPGSSNQRRLQLRRSPLRRDVQLCRFV